MSPKLQSLRADDGARLAYRLFGSGRRDVILLHGWGTTGEVWGPMIDLLDLTGVRLVIPDLRGTGASEASAERITLERLAEDMLALIAALGGGPVALVGHSLGGCLAQYVSALVPAKVAAQLLMLPVPASGAKVPQEIAALFRTAGGHPDRVGAILDRSGRAWAPATRQLAIDRAMTIPDRVLEELFEVWSTADFADRLSAITAPTVVIATDDPVFSRSLLEQEVVARIRGARLEYLPGPGHYLQQERPAQAAAAVQAFFASLR